MLEASLSGAGKEWGAFMRLSRRAAVGMLLTGASVLISGNFLATEALAARKRTPSKKPASKKPAAAGNKPAGLKPGQFEWHPHRSPSGPLAIIVSLTKQRVYVYRNGIQIGVSTCSTGKKDYDTPTGVFTILEKEEEHYSNTYDNAAMPMMQRLTWDGIALHAGKLPGYPASHGCVRLPKAFAEKLYAVTQTGTPVIIADEATQPSSVYDPGLLLGAEAKDELGKASKKKKKPAFSKSSAVTSILVSSADKSIYVIQNGDIVAQGKAEIEDPDKKLGSNVFILVKGDEDGFTWEATGYSTGKKAASKPSTSIVERIKPPADVQAAIDERMKPGMVFVTTDQPATPETRSGKDFTVMDSEGK
jgi:lipoprotein-anchoring transpeptidase ErfK/SrfK